MKNKLDKIDNYILWICKKCDGTYFDKFDHDQETLEEDGWIDDDEDDGKIHELESFIVIKLDEVKKLLWNLLNYLEG